MSRCHQTDALLDATFAGTGLTRALADHAVGCAECAHSLAQARRFDRELRAVGADLVPEPIRPGEASADVSAPIRRGGLTMWRRGLAAVAGGAVVLAVAVYGGGAVVGSLLSGQVQVGRIGADELGPWLDRALVAAHGESERDVSRVANWEPAQIETCGTSAVVFFVDRNQLGGSYLWAVGRPGDMFDPSINTGWSRTLGDPDVARLRAMLPICEVTLGGLEPPAELVDVLPVAPQRVVRVPDLWWEGERDDAPYLVETTGPGAEDVRVGIHQDAFMYGRVDSTFVRAVEIITTDGRLRYTVGVPGFVIQSDLGAEAFRFELLDSGGLVIASGPVVDWEADEVLDRLREVVRLEARAVALARAERLALEAGGGGATCAAWRTMTDQEQLMITEVVVSDLERARIRQQLPTDASVDEIIAGARASLDKGCQGLPADHAVADISRTLYGSD